MSILYDTNAEQFVLGAAILNKECLLELISSLNENDFFHDQNRYIFQAIINLDKDRSIIDAVTICNELKKRKLLEDVGGRSYIISILEEIPNVTTMKSHIEIIKENAIKRSLIDLSVNISNSCNDQSSLSSDILSNTQKDVMEISQRNINQILIGVLIESIWIICNIFPFGPNCKPPR